MPDDKLIDPDDCWRWPGAHRTDDDRPLIGNRYVYRVIYEALSGAPVPDDVLHHTCENPWCVNPYHLAPLSRAEHLEEHRPLMPMMCRNRHVLGGDNLYTWRGKRYCRACHRATEARRKARVRDASRKADRP